MKQAHWLSGIGQCVEVASPHAIFRVRTMAVPRRSLRLLSGTDGARAADYAAIGSGRPIAGRQPRTGLWFSV